MSSFYAPHCRSTNLALTSLLLSLSACGGGALSPESAPLSLDAPSVTLVSRTADSLGKSKNAEGSMTPEIDGPKEDGPLTSYRVPANGAPSSDLPAALQATNSTSPLSPSFQTLSSLATVSSTTPAAGLVPVAATTAAVTLKQAATVAVQANSAGRGEMTSSPPSPLSPYLPSAKNSFPDGSRRVWVHEMISVPTFTPATPYGADYPLVLRQTVNSPRRPQEGPSLYLNAGITGIELLWSEGQDGKGQFQSRLKDFENTELELAPCLGISTIAGGVAMVDEYLSYAREYKASAKITIAGETYYIISIYGSRFSQTPEFWKQFRQTLAAGNRKVFLMADIVTAISNNGGSLLPDKIDYFAKASLRSFLGIFDSVWTFDDGVESGWASLMALLSGTSEPFSGGMMPGTNRESTPDGGYSDAKGTEKYRKQWEDSLGSGLAWNHVVSWNDVSERHSIWPSSEWSYTRADITKFYSERMRGIKWDGAIATPQLYVTVPQRIALDGPTRAGEVLLLNTSTKNYKIQGQVVDFNGAPVNQPIEQPAESGKATAIQMPLQFDRMPAPGYVRLRARSFDENGKLVQEVISSPVLVYSSKNVGSEFDTERVKYNSIPARLSLPGSIRLSIQGLSATSSGAASVSYSGGNTPRFVDVLQNAYLAGSAFANQPLNIPVPIENGKQNMSGVVVTTPRTGYYLARVIDEEERVGYSDPIEFKAQ